MPRDDIPLSLSKTLINYSTSDNVPEEILPLVHSHWYHFSPLNPKWYGFLEITITILGVLSVVGNFVVIWILTRTKTLRSPANSLLVNLAFSDFLMMFTLFPPMVYNCYWRTWVSGLISCEVYGVIGKLCECVAIYSMVWIIIDRYKVIVKGISATPLNAKEEALRILFSWIFSAAWCLFPFFGWSRYFPEGNMTVCGTDYPTDDLFSRSHLYVYSVWVFFTPFLLILYYYTYIAKDLAVHEKQMLKQEKKMEIKILRTEEDQKTSAEIHLAKVALATVSLMAWCPYLIINWSGMLRPLLVMPLFSVWGSLFAKASAVYNLIVDAISKSKYRRTFLKAMPFLACNTEACDKGEEMDTTTPLPEKAHENVKGPKQCI